MKRYKKHFTNSYREIFDELEVEGFLRKITEIQATELVIKNKKFIDNSRQMYQRVFEDMCKRWPQFENILYFRFIGLKWNQDLQRFGRKELTSLTARVSIQFILLNGKRWKDIWFHWFRIIRHRYDNLWWHRCSIILDPQEFLNCLTRTTSQRFLHDTQTRHRFHIMQCQSIRLNWVEREYRVNHQNMRRTKRSRSTS